MPCSHAGSHEPVRGYCVHAQVCFYPIDPMTDSNHIPTSISEWSLLVVGSGNVMPVWESLGSTCLIGSARPDRSGHS